MRVLIVDDDAVMCKVMAAMLGRAGYDVDLAHDGVTGVEMWEASTYNCVLMDVQMPRMSGLEATRLIREKEILRGGHIPIIAITAFSNDKSERCFSAGMDAFLAKPINFEQLFEKLKRFT